MNSVTKLTSKALNRLPSSANSLRKKVFNKTWTDLFFKQMSGDTVEMRELAARICRDYLSGAWKSVTAQNIGFKHISGGLSNLLYHIQLPDCVKHLKNPDDPQEVLIRVYGQTHGDGALEAIITESVIFTLLSERGLGPKLHGIFPGGRIEEYIQARQLTTEELSDPKLSRHIAKKMASIHSMEVPLNKDPHWLWDTIEKWLRTCEARLRKSDIPDVAKSLLSYDLRSEAKWLRDQLDKLNCPVVFCHNDMQEGNILLKLEEEEDDDNKCNNNNIVNEDQKDPRMVVIDFEYCSYNYRSFDIANHFMEWVYNYTDEQHPYFRENYKDYPNESQQLNFIEAYLEERGSKEDPRNILKEIKVFSLASHLFWGLWSIVNAEVAQIPFGYWEYAVSRIEHYFELKPLVTKNAQGKRRMYDCLE